jgi:hypothetical protein
MTKEKPHKKGDPKNDHNKAEEPSIVYFTEPVKENITVSSLQKLKAIDRKHTKELTPKQRMEYLQKLNANLFGFDLSHQKMVLEEGEIYIRKKT